MENLYKLQKRIVRHIDCTLPNKHCMPIFKKMSFLTIYDQVELENVKLVYRIVNENVPRFLLSVYSKNSCRSSRNNNFVIDANYTKRMNKSFLVKAISLWNKLKISVKNSTSCKTFIRKTKDLYLSKY